jgi:transcriptional regulator with XRE-family HTH domain
MDLLKIRKQLKLSQQELAEKLGIGRSTYIKYENNEKDISDIEDEICSLVTRNKMIQEDIDHTTARKELIEIAVLSESTQNALTRMNKIIENLLGKQ